MSKVNQPGHSSAPGSAPDPTKLPKGVVLGKDGKPCRSCSSYASFTSQAKSLKGAMGAAGAGAAAAAAATATAASAAGGPPTDCPADVETLGRSAWTVLHTMAATYPEKPSRGEQSDMAAFMGLFAKLYPCWVCAEDFQAYLAKERVRTAGRDDFGDWLCRAHNEVNRKLGKPEFDCRLWQERWRTGWKDGRCD